MSSIDHLLVLTPGFPANAHDDVCIPYFQDYLKLLMAAHPGLRVSVIAFQYPYRKAKYDWNGVAVHALGGGNKAWRKPLIWSRAMRTFKRIHKAHKVSVIHSLWLNETAWTGMKLSRRHKVPHVATLMGQDVLPNNRWLKRMDFSTLKTVALSPRSADDLKANAGVAVDALLPFAEPPVAASTGDPRDVDILGVGSFIPSKKFDRFLRVIRLLADRHPRLRVVLAGDGPERGKLKALANELQLDGIVEFTGQQSRAQVLAWMRRSRVLLHPSLQEGQCYVFAEALNRGMQIVSSPIGVAEPGPDWAVHMDAVRMAESVAGLLRGPGADVQVHLRANAEAGQRLIAGYWELYGG